MKEREKIISVVNLAWCGGPRLMRLQLRVKDTSKAVEVANLIKNCFNRKFPQYLFLLLLYVVFLWLPCFATLNNIKKKKSRKAVFVQLRATSIILIVVVIWTQWRTKWDAQTHTQTREWEELVKAILIAQG